MKIKSFSTALNAEFPQDKAVLAHYKNGPYELTYLAARHSNTLGSDTLNLVDELFKNFKFDVLIIEPLPYSSGESPSWLVNEAKKGRTNNFISGGESSLAVIRASEKHIPFYGGEPDHKLIYDELKKHGYSDEDIFGFYVVRQIPEWVRDREAKGDLLDRKVPSFIKLYCKIFFSSKCPTLIEIKNWYKAKIGHDLTVDVSNEDVAPLSDGHLLTQKISSDVGYIRDHFTLALIQKFLEKYKKVAIIYGAGHFVTLRKSLDSSLGLPTFTKATGDSIE